MLMRPLTRLRLEIPEDPEARTRQQEEFLVNSQELLEAFEEKLRREGLEKGLKEGRQMGREEGRLEEARVQLRRLAVRRFGKLPAWLEKWCAAQTQSETVEQAAEELLEARTPADLKKRVHA